ncbi:MAG TPA: hypothetical protein VLM18_02780 [Croceibacterium sp.]|nr:hypothetical protein [Croceibacterium sp.]
MNPLEVRLAEDRALRDAALEVFSTDLRFIRQDLRARSVGKRIADRIGDSAMEIVDEAVDYAEANRGRIAAAAAAIVLWFARAPLLNGLSRIFGLERDDEEQDGDEARSDDD